MEDIRTLVSRYANMATGRQWQRATRFGSLPVAQVELGKVELARAGRYFFGGNQIIANGIAPVAAIPTTASAASMFNRNAAGGDSLLLDYINGPWLGSGTAAAGAVLLCGISSTIAAGTLPTAHLTGWSARTAGGSATRQPTSSVWWDATATFTAASTIWFSVGQNFQLAAANVGQGAPNAIYLGGAIVVPPAYMVGFSILSGTGTSPLYGLSTGWAELPVDIE